MNHRQLHWTTTTMPTGRATIAVGNEEEPHPPPARSSGARPKERRRGAGPPSWRASTPPEKLQNLAQEDRGSAAPVVIFGDAALSCNRIGPRNCFSPAPQAPMHREKRPAAGLKAAACNGFRTP
ncbi:unnamed protein product, partial [Prorocentrum cordatum]